MSQRIHTNVTFAVNSFTSVSPLRNIYWVMYRNDWTVTYVIVNSRRIRIWCDMRWFIVARNHTNVRFAIRISHTNHMSRCICERTLVSGPTCVSNVAKRSTARAKSPLMTKAYIRGCVIMFAICAEIASRQRAIWKFIFARSIRANDRSLVRHVILRLRRRKRCANMYWFIRRRASNAISVIECLLNRRADGDMRGCIIMLREVEQLRFTNLKYSYLIYFNGIAETIFEIFRL